MRGTRSGIQNLNRKGRWPECQRNIPKSREEQGPGIIYTVSTARMELSKKIINSLGRG